MVWKIAGEAKRFRFENGWSERTRGFESLIFRQLPHGCSMQKNDLFFHLPEITFPCDELREWGFRNEGNFTQSRESVGGLFGCLIPFHYTKILNDQVELDTLMYNSSVPIFKRGQIYIVNEEYPMHTDVRRDASLNFVLSGDAVTMWNEGTVCEYLPNMATLFNTQVPHKVTPNGDVPRMAISFSVSMSYQRFINLHKSNIIFGRRDRVTNFSEIIPK